MRLAKFLDIDGFRDDDLAKQLFLRLVRRVSLEALGTATERWRSNARARRRHERGDQGQAAALFCGRGFAVVFGAAGGADGAAGAATDLARTFVLVGDVAAIPGARATGTAARRGCGPRFGLAKTLLGFKLGLALASSS